MITNMKEIYLVLMAGGLLFSWAIVAYLFVHIQKMHHRLRHLVHDSMAKDRVYLVTVLEYRELLAAAKRVLARYGPKTPSASNSSQDWHDLDELIKAWEKSVEASKPPPIRDHVVPSLGRPK